MQPRISQGSGTPADRRRQIPPQSPRKNRASKPLGSPYRTPKRTQSYTPFPPRRPLRHTRIAAESSRRDRMREVLLSRMQRPLPVSPKTPPRRERRVLSPPPMRRRSGRRAPDITSQVDEDVFVPQQRPPRDVDTNTRSFVSILGSVVRRSAGLLSFELSHLRNLYTRVMGKPTSSDTNGEDKLRQRAADEENVDLSSLCSSSQSTLDATFDLVSLSPSTTCSSLSPYLPLARLPDIGNSVKVEIPSTIDCKPHATLPSPSLPELLLYQPVEVAEPGQVEDDNESSPSPTPYPADVPLLYCSQPGTPNPSEQERSLLLSPPPVIYVEPATPITPKRPREDSPSPPRFVKRKRTRLVDHPDVLFDIDDDDVVVAFTPAPKRPRVCLCRKSTPPTVYFQMRALLNFDAPASPSRRLPSGRRVEFRESPITQDAFDCESSVYLPTNLDFES